MNNQAELTTEEKIQRISDFCDLFEDCTSCPLTDTKKCNSCNDVSDADIDCAFALLPEEYRTAPTIQAAENDPVNHPSHYTTGKIECIDFIEDKQLCYHLGNAVKYICRAGKKDPDKTVQDLQKAVWYLNRKIEALTSEDSTP